jgi:branched-chain amino acid transport system substrate-binding protein
MRRLLALAAALLLLVAAMPLRAADEPYEFYVILSLTGTAAFLGRDEVPAVQAAEKWVNAHGGIKGRPLHVNILDDASNAATAVQFANQIMAKGVPAFVGPAFGATCQAVDPLVEANGPMMFCLTGIGHPAAGSFVFLMNLNNREYQANGFRYLRAKGVRKIALLQTTDATGTDAEKNAQDAIKYPDLRDLQIVDVEHFAPTDLTVAAQVARIKAAGAEAIDTFVTGTAFGTAIRGIYEGGFSGYVFTASSNASKEQMRQYAAFLPEKLFFNTTGYQLASGVPRQVQAARTVYLEAIKQVGVTDPVNGNIVPWDPLMITLEALRKIGPTATAKQMRDYVYGLKGWPGIMGFYDFSRGDQRGLDPRSSGAMTYERANESFVVVSKAGGAPL